MLVKKIEVRDLNEVISRYGSGPGSKTFWIDPDDPLKLIIEVRRSTSDREIRRLDIPAFKSEVELNAAKKRLKATDFDFVLEQWYVYW